MGDHQTASAFRALATAQERALDTQGEKGRGHGVVLGSGQAPLSEGTRGQEVGGCAREFGGVGGGVWGAVAW